MIARIFAAVTFVLAACSSVPKGDQSTLLQYNQLNQFYVGSSTEDEVLKILGYPTNREDRNGYYTFNYLDSKSGDQRLSLSFIATTKKLSGILWIPNQDEKEISLDQAKAGFQGAHFRELREGGNNPHSVSEADSYVDEKLGITIRYDRARAVVQAIALYDVNHRSPTATDKAIQVPYTFGDGVVGSK